MLPRRVIALIQATFLILLAAILLTGCPDWLCALSKDCGPVITSETKCWGPNAAAPTAACGGDMNPRMIGVDHEPNDTLLLATQATNVYCSENSVTGIVGGQDVDIFSFAGSRCDDDPAPTVQLLEPGPSAATLQICMFVECSTGSSAIGDPQKEQAGCIDGEATRMPSGMLGCCTTGRKTSVQLRCSNHKHDVKGYIVVDGPGDQCLPYKIRYAL